MAPLNDLAAECGKRKGKKAAQKPPPKKPKVVQIKDSESDDEFPLKALSAAAAAGRDDVVSLLGDAMPLHSKASSEVQFHDRCAALKLECSVVPVQRQRASPPSPPRLHECVF